MTTYEEIARVDIKDPVAVFDTTFLLVHTGAGAVFLENEGGGSFAVVADVARKPTAREVMFQGDNYIVMITEEQVTIILRRL